VYNIDLFGDAVGFLAVVGLNLIAVVFLIYTIMFYYIPTLEVPNSLAVRMRQV
jgi:hypothetical protein